MKANERLARVGHVSEGTEFYTPMPAGYKPGQTRYVRLSIEGATGNAASVGRQDMRLEESEKIAQQEMSPLKYWGAGSRERVKLRP